MEIPQFVDSDWNTSTLYSALFLQYTAYYKKVIKLDLHQIIIVTKRILDNDIIAIYIEIFHLINR